MPVIALVALVFSGARAEPACSGAACQAVTLAEKDGCAWLESTSSHPITATVTLAAGGTLTRALEAADLDKARAREAARRERELKSRRAAAECPGILNSAKWLEDFRARGGDAPYAPEIEGRVPECRKLMAEGASEETAFHFARYNPLVPAGEVPVFTTKLLQGSACVQPADITGITANYEAAAPSAGN
jgi:hypothetical protein